MSIHANSLDQCIACTSCIVQCPVMAATNKFRGPKIVGPTLERFRLLQDDVEQALEFCSNCKNCDITCPSGVSVSTINMQARARYYRDHKHSLGEWVLAHGEFMAKMSMPTAALTNVALKNPISKFMLKQLGITGARELPPYATKTFRPLFRAVSQRTYDAKVVFFPGCFINYNKPQVGIDLVNVMQKNGYEVLLPDTVCCGSPLVVGGYMEEAAINARRNIAELNSWIIKGYPVITACSSCGLMLKQEYQELFQLKGMAEMAAGIYDISEFLCELLEDGKLNKEIASLEGRYLYHAPCHLRVQGIGKPALHLLRDGLNVEVEDANAGCCGISGNYGFKASRYEISMHIGSELFNKVHVSKADAVITECGTCSLQIAHGTGVKTLHPVSLLNAAYKSDYLL